MHEGVLTERPAGVVAGGHGLLPDGCRLQLGHAQADEVPRDRGQVGRTQLGQVPHQRKRALPYIRRLILQANFSLTSLGRGAGCLN